MRRRTATRQMVSNRKEAMMVETDLGGVDHVVFVCLVECVPRWDIPWSPAVIRRHDQVQMGYSVKMDIERSSVGSTCMGAPRLVHLREPDTRDCSVRLIRLRLCRDATCKCPTIPVQFTHLLIFISTTRPQTTTHHPCGDVKSISRPIRQIQITSIPIPTAPSIRSQLTHDRNQPQQNTYSLFFHRTTFASRAIRPC